MQHKGLASEEDILDNFFTNIGDNAIKFVTFIRTPTNFSVAGQARKLMWLWAGEKVECLAFVWCVYWTSFVESGYGYDGMMLRYMG